MSRKQRKYEKEIRARKAAEAKVEAEEKAKAERKEAAQQRAKAEEQRRAALTPEERAAEDKRNGIIGLIFVAIVAVVILVSCDFGGGDDASDPTPANETTTTTEEDTFEVTEIEARTQCQDLVEQRLKAPKTADFPWLDGEWKYTPVDGGYKVESYVDAENSFGAQIRSHFGCTVTKLDESRVNRTLDYFE